MTEQTILVPKRRFKEFLNSHDWEQRELSDLAEVRTGKAFSSTDFSDDGEYLVVTNKNIMDEANGITSEGDRIDISDDTILNNYLLSGDNILVTMDGVNIGKTGKFSNEKAILAQRVGRLNSKQLEFVYQVTSNKKFVSEMNKLSVGNAIKHISLNQISDYSFLAPTSEEEQEKIGTFFNQFDETITLHQRKLEKTIALKAAYLSEMFPAEGESEPKRRFAGFTGAWEQRELGEIVREKISNGMMNRPGKNKLHVQHINVVNLYSPSHIHPEELEFIDATQFEVGKYNVEIGDIFLTRSSLKVEGIAQANIILEEGNFVFDDHLMRMKLKDKYYPFFVKELLNSRTVKNQFMSKAKTGTMTTIGQGDISSSYAMFPNIDEQRKVGAFFRDLDNLITLHQSKLEKLQNLKKAYLNEMFV